MRFVVVAVLLLAVVACGGSSAATTSPSPATRSATPHTPSPTAVPSPTATPTPTPEPTVPPTPAPTPEPTPVPTPSPTPVPIHHPPPYTIAIDAGHGGPWYPGASTVDAEGNLWVEKNETLAVALRVQQLLSEAGYGTIMMRTDDSTITTWNPADYRGSMIDELQARVDRANAAGADVLLSIHFNGWVDGSARGTEAYCNPDRSFGRENCGLASFVQQALVHGIRGAGYDIYDRGIKNDAGVNGDPRNSHSYLLGTNYGFRPSLMPGTIAEVLFLSNPDDLTFLKQPDAIDVIAEAFVSGLNDYFAWLNAG